MITAPNNSQKGGAAPGKSRVLVFLCCVQWLGVIWDWDVLRALQILQAMKEHRERRQNLHFGVKLQDEKVGILFNYW